MTRPDPPVGSPRWRLSLALEMLAIWPVVLVATAYDAVMTLRERWRR